MRALAATLIAGATMSAMAAGSDAAVKRRGQTPARAEQDVRAAERQFNDARVHADVAALARLLDEAWTITHGDGTIDTKAQYLSDLKSGARTFESVNEDEASVRTY